MTNSFILHINNDDPQKNENNVKFQDCITLFNILLTNSILLVLFLNMYVQFIKPLT